MDKLLFVVVLAAWSLIHEVNSQNNYWPQANRCPVNYYEQNNICIPYNQSSPARVACPPNSVYSNGVCLMQQQQLQQPLNYQASPYFQTSQASCNDNMVLYGGRCQPQSIATCPYTSSLQNGVCMRNQMAQPVLPVQALDAPVLPTVVQPQMIAEPVMESIIQPDIIQPQIIVQEPVPEISNVIQPVESNIHRESIVREVSSQGSGINIYNVVNSTNIENVVTNINSSNINNIKIDGMTKSAEMYQAPEHNFIGVPQPYPMPLPIQIPVPQPIQVPVPHPIEVRVPQPVEVPVPHPVPVPQPVPAPQPIVMPQPIPYQMQQPVYQQAYSTGGCQMGGCPQRAGCSVCQQTP